MLKVDELRADVERGAIDTVIAAFTDMQGRLMGKRLHAEFFMFRESFEEARAKHYRELTPSVPYILDYNILASGYDEPFLRRVRNEMQGAGMIVEGSKGEAWAGQHELNFKYADALKAADD